MIINQTPGLRKTGLECHSCALIAAALLLITIALPIAAQPEEETGPVRLDFPTQSPGIPAYARLELLIPDFDVPNNDEWAAIVFYRDPDCIPLDFDLGQFFHIPGPEGPGAFGCPLLVEGFELWASGPQDDMAPIYARTRSAVPALPIWFVAWPELASLFDHGMVFIDEIEALPSLIRGSAWWFEESLHPNGSAPDPGISLNARGRLESGGRFFLEWHYHASSGEDYVSIDLELEDGPTSNPKPPHLICLIHPNLARCNR